MFETCDWNDEGEDVTRSPVTAARKRISSVSEKGTNSRKKRLKRNRQLLEVLRTLNTSSTLHPDLPPPPEATPTKRQKKTAPDVMSAGTSPPEDAPWAERPLESGERLSRQQWRNKLKNKRKSRNKYKVVTGTIGETAEGQEGAAARDRGAGALEEKPRSHGDRKITSQQPQGKRNGAISGKGGEETSAHPGGSARKWAPKTKRAGDPRRDDPTPQMTPQDRARLQKLKKIMQRQAGGPTAKTPSKEDPHETVTDLEQPEADNCEAKRDPSAELRARMEQRLNAARFRYINQQLYTADSREALRLFQQDPEAFSIYHSGFSQQVQRWPVNPITKVIKYIKNRPPSLLVADFGCGDALLARSVRNKVHSFDLVALNEHVTVCDIAKVPLLDGSVDVVVFCLSLMGKNLGDFLQEANRVLKLGGVLLVAEVSSRFDDVRQFLSAMSQLGFKAINKDTENKYFFLFEFSKTGCARKVAKHAGLELKPCLYKKR